MGRDGAKQWVTVKVPREDKEQADDYRPDESTFGDCLVAGAERLADGLDSDTRRFEPDDATADVDALADRLVDELAATAGGPQVDDSDIAREVVRQFDYTELATAVANELEGRMR
jgi:hypothetical protein